MDITCCHYHNGVQK